MGNVTKRLCPRFEDQNTPADETLNPFRVDKTHRLHFDISLCNLDYRDDCW